MSCLICRLAVAVLVYGFPFFAAAFNLDRNPAQPIKHSPVSEHRSVSPTRTRRQILGLLPATLFLKSLPSKAAMENSQKVFTAGQSLGISQSKERFKEARKTLDYLIENYDEISHGGGDNVRRYLGTVGTTSALYGIGKVMKELQSEASDIVEYTESMSDFEYNINAADTAVYSANFVEFSAASTKPEKFFKDAKKNLAQAKVYMDRMAAELEL